MLNFTIDKKSNTPLYIQIRDSIKTAIQGGDLKTGERLPSVSSLAKDIGVTQATVRRALQDLGQEGYTSCHVGRGTFIQSPGSNIEIEPGNTMSDKPIFGSTLSEQGITAPNPMKFAARQLRMGIGKALKDIMSLSEQPGIIHLSKGVPDPKMLPPSFLEDITRETLNNFNMELTEATDPLGRLDLRQEIAHRFSKQEIGITPDQVLITNGSMQGITLVAQAAIDTKHNILCETPGFKGVTDTFTAMGHWVDTIPMDQDGQMPGLPARMPGQNPFMMYICPYAHNPTGVNISKKRYTKLVEWARQTGSTIIADEIFKDICFSKNLPPSIMKGLGADQSIIISSLSKSVMTGLRLGWIISSSQKIQELAQLKRLMDHSCPSLIQGIALTLFKSGRFDLHTQKMKELYKSRRDTMIEALERYMPKEITWTRPDGSFSLMLELPGGYSSVALFLATVQRGVSFLPGPLFDIDHRFVGCIRISYAWSDIDQIQEGIELLAGAIDDFISKPPSDSGLSGLGGYQ